MSDFDNQNPNDNRPASTFGQQVAEDAQHAVEGVKQGLGQVGERIAGAAGAVKDAVTDPKAFGSKVLGFLNQPFPEEAPALTYVKNQLAEGQENNRRFMEASKTLAHDHFNREALGTMVDHSLTNVMAMTPGMALEEGVAREVAPSAAGKLIHYSRAEAPLTEIDPSKMGTGAAGREARRGASRTQVSYYYDAGTRPEDVVLQGAKHAHVVETPKAPILDLHSPEAAPFLEKAGDMDEALEAIKKAGYSGYRNSHPANPVQNGVALFDKQPVVMSAPVDAEHFAQASRLPVSAPKPVADAPGSNTVRQVAQSYMEANGAEHRPHQMVDVSPERGAKIAQAFEEMPHNPSDPKVRAAYQALIDETKAQWDHIQKQTGLKVEPMQPGQANPYASGSKAVFEDINKNNHLWYYPTEQGFGTSADPHAASHPMYTQKVNLNGQQVPANDLFRIVHDYFGHAKEGNGFGPKGEENAYQAHAQMYSPMARQALATETRGQNSWVNFGPHGEANRANPGATRYADQKAGLLPDWAVYDGVQGVRREAGEMPGQKVVEKGADLAGDAMKKEPAEASRMNRAPDRPVVAPVLNDKGMYSAAETAVNNIPDNAGKMNIGQVMNKLRGAGVRQAELDHLGMDEFLAGKKSVSKQELLDHIAGNKLDLKEVVKGGVSPELDDAKLTPEMKAKIKKGLPMFAVGGMVTGAAIAPQTSRADSNGVQHFAEGGMAQPTQPGANSSPIQYPGTPTPQGMPTAINVVDPDTGEVGSIPHEQLPTALSQGYRQASPDEVEMHFRHQKYGGGIQGAKAFGEGALQGLGGPLGTAAEVGMGVDPADIRGRAEEHPLAHGIGVGTGLAAPLLATAGAGALARAGVEGAAGVAEGLNALRPMTQQGILDLAGHAGADALGLGRIGSAIARGAIDTAVFQAGDEASKMILQDPSQTAQTAAINVGLAGILGGALGGATGAALPLWQATAGKGMGAMLGAVAKRVGGIEGVIADPINEAITKLGVDVAPEVRAALSNDPKVRAMFETLNQSDTTKAGQSMQASVENFRRQMETTLVEALGRSPEAVGANPMSKYEVGKAMADQLAREYQAKIDPSVKAFEDFRARYSDAPLPASVAQKEEATQGAQAKLLKQMEKLQRQAARAQKLGDVEGAVEAAAKHEELMQQARMLQMQGQAPGVADTIAEQIAHVAEREGWFKIPDSDIANHVNKVLKVLPEQATIGDLQKLISSVSDTMQKDRLGNGPLYRAGGILKSILKDAEGSALESAVGEKEGAEALQKLQGARAGYRAAAELKEAIDDRLGVRGSTSAYAKNLREFAANDGEAVVRKLGQEKDASLLKLLEEHFPGTAEMVRQYHLENIVQQAASKAKGEQLVNPTHILKAIQGMSPELREFAVGESAQKVDAVATLLDQLNSNKHNFSNTARTIDKLMAHVPGSAIGLIGMLTGHNPALAMMMPSVTKFLARDIPDAARLAMLKFLGTAGKDINPGAFKVMTDYISHAQEGQNLMAKAARNIFRSDISTALPESLKVSDADRAKLDSQLRKLQQDPNALTSVAGHTEHYMPDHAQATGEFAANAANFLNSLRPSTEKALPLDSARVVSKVERAAFDRALNIAQQPLTILEHIKKGNITPTDVQVFQKLYPDLYPKLVNQLHQEMIDHINRGETVPYKTRLSLSIFMAQPLDSTMTPAGIAGAQPNPVPPAGGGGPQGNIKKSSATLSKVSKENMTSGQRRENGPPGKR
jgi:hypothetical protein